MPGFFQELATQRWDDHRYYHHSLVNQSLHLVSAVSFVCSYVLLFVNPALAAVLAWLVSMTSRQAGHFFFEPKDYDHVNQATNEYKEEIKVGYNIKRKIVLMLIWAASPLFLLAYPAFFGLMEPHHDFMSFVQNTGWLWLAIGVGGLLFRTIHLFFIQNVQAGLVWACKILTDPFHDIMLYHKAPLALIRGALAR